MILASFVISAFAILVSSIAIISTRHTVKTTAHRNQQHAAPRHTVTRNPAGPRRQPPTPITRERIPLQVPPDVNAHHTHTIDTYGAGDDDLLIRPFVPPHTDEWRITPGAEEYLFTPEQAGYPADNTTAVSAVP